MNHEADMSEIFGDTGSNIKWSDVVILPLFISRHAIRFREQAA